MIYLMYILTAVIAYLLGSISVGILTSKLLGGPNLREVGSGNTGATNALRAMGLKGGIIVFVGDILKALIASLIGRALCGFEGMLIAAVCVIAGHIWPVFFGFKGGKGVSCVCGAIFLAYNPEAVLAYLLTIGIIALTKYVSLGSCCLVSIFAILVTIREALTGIPHWYAIPWAFAIAALVIWRHKENIVRLAKGTERKLGEKKQ
ncbi:MAG: glycerol-3-phosphate 1-O-acyltransferase PlsY [Clostridia bacterium]|nr:glycerol-3-phosphate 1-O-acyltransferase PlsY [Clostridia bacterium]